MSKAGKIFLIGGLLFWAAMYAFRLVYGGWHQALWVPLVLGVLLLAAGAAKDWRNILEFFTMRTTKHGLNMGAVILIALVGLTCVNILSVKYNHKFDWTSDKLNSLSEQSVKLAHNLTQDTRFVLLFRTDDQNGESVQRQVKELAGLYQNVSPRISFEAHNAIVDPATAKSYDYSAGPFALFVQQGERKLKVDVPNEEGITRALIKLSRTSKKVVYFITGHGERDLEAKDADGLSFLVDELKVTYDVRPLTLYSVQNKVPADAAAVAIVRPTQQYLDNEIHALREYVTTSGGKLLIAIDPGMKQNLAGLARSFGVDFHNDYVIDLRSRTLHMGPASVLGTNYPDQSDITQGFPESSFSLFQIASSLKKAVDAPADSKVIGLIGTDAQTMATTELGEVTFKPNGPHIIGMEATSGKSVVVVFGDSDFMCNAFIQQNLNNDLAMNIFAELANDKDLISIRPRVAKGTKMEMSRANFGAYTFLFLLPLPLALFALGAALFWRRRTA